MRRLMPIIGYVLDAFGPAQEIEVMLHVRFRRFNDHNQLVAFRRRRHRQCKQANSLATKNVHEPANDNEIIFRFDGKQPFHTWLSSASEARGRSKLSHAFYTAHRSSRTSSSSRTTRGGSTIISASDAPGGTIG